MAIAMAIIKNDKAELEYLSSPNTFDFFFPQVSKAFYVEQNRWSG